MGLFSSKKKTVVGTTVSRVIEDRLLPDSVKTGLNKALFSDEPETSIPEYVLEELVGGLGVRVERMYQYAKRNYTWGLPTDINYLNSEATEDVATVLAGIEGQSVSIEYSQFGPPNMLHLGWMRLISQYGYNPATNQIAALTALKGKPVHLWDMVVLVPSGSLDTYGPGALDQWGLPPNAMPTPERVAALNLMRIHTPVTTDATINSEFVQVTFAYTSEDGYVHENLTIPITGLADDKKDYFHVKYTVGGVTKYWMYQHGLGTYPLLDSYGTTPHTVNGSFFPFAYFRFNKLSTTTNKTSEEYLTSKKMLDYIGIDYDDMADKINANPDIKDVEQAMLVFAIPAESANQLDLRYLFDFFNSKHAQTGTIYQSPTAEKLAGVLNTRTTMIQDKRFKMVLNNEGIYKRLRAGSIGSVGTYASEIRPDFIMQSYVDNDTGQTLEQAVPYTSHYYRKQITSNMYEEIQLLNLSMSYNIIGDYYATGDGDSDILLVPLDKSITEDYSIPDRELLYARSMHFVFNSVQVVKIKWYQQSWFKAILIVVAVVITVVSYGTAAQTLVAAVAAGTVTITMAILTILVKLVIGFLIGLAFKLFVKVVGVKFAFIAAIMVAVAAAYGYFDPGTFGSIAGAPWADILLNISSNLVQGIQSTLKDLVGDLIGEAQAFGIYVDEANKALTEANKLLETNNYLQPFVIFGESPEDYFNRTVHSGNIGIVGISAISSYVDIALTLPKLNDTLGDDYGLPTESE